MGVNLIASNWVWNVRGVNIAQNDKIMKRTISLSRQNHLEKMKDDIAHGITLWFVAKSNSMRPFIVAERDEVILKLVDEDSF